MEVEVFGGTIMAYSSYFIRSLLGLLFLLIAQYATATTTACTAVSGPTFTYATGYGGPSPYTYTGAIVGNWEVLGGTLTVTVSCNGITDPGASNGLGLGITLTGINANTNWSPIGNVTVANYNTTGSGCVPGSSTTVGVAPSPSSSYLFSNNSSTNCTFTYTTQLLYKFYTSAGMGSGNIFNGVSLVVEDLQQSTGGSSSYKILTNLPLTPYILQYMDRCTVSAGSQSINVPLPQVDKQALSATGATAGRTAFSVVLQGCTSPTSPATSYTATTTWNFTAGSSSSSIANTASSPAANVQIQLLDANANVISTGGTKTQTITSGSSTYTQNYYAQYLATGGAAGAGAVTGVATFTITYN
jgi:major type 1 subunit fimbrin (pilin)